MTDSLGLMPQTTAERFRNIALPACNSLATLLLTGMLLASSFALAADPADTAESALAQAEVAVAKARARNALWSTAWAALLEARRARNKQDYEAAARWSARAEELAGLGLTQAGQEADPSSTARPSTTGENR